MVASTLILGFPILFRALTYIKVTHRNTQCIRKEYLSVFVRVLMDLLY
jgi:hypothetical protein